MPGTALGTEAGNVVYTPPVGEDRLRSLLANWERSMHEQKDIDRKSGNHNVGRNKPLRAPFRHACDESMLCEYFPCPPPELHKRNTRGNAPMSKNDPPSNQVNMPQVCLLSAYKQVQTRNHP